VERVAHLAPIVMTHAELLSIRLGMNRANEIMLLTLHRSEMLTPRASIT
jgi:hypothetical protein